MSGNGTDQGHIVAMLGELITAVERLRVDVGQVRGEMNQMRGELNQMRGELNQLKSDFELHRAETKREFTTVRSTITLYHGSVMGHGFLLTELQDLTRRIADHVELPPVA